MDPSFLALICLFAGNFAPTSWAFCQGQILSLPQNAALFTILGTTYGGNGQTTFALPDLRGRAPIGWGQGPGLSPYNLGQLGGSESMTLTINEMPSHIHSANLSGLTAAQPASTGAGTTSTPGPNAVPAVLPSIGAGPNAMHINGYTTAAPNTTLSPAAVGGNITMNPSGGNQPFSIISPYLAMNYIICIEGVFPSRS